MFDERNNGLSRRAIRRLTHHDANLRLVVSDANLIFDSLKDVHHNTLRDWQRTLLAYPELVGTWKRIAWAFRYFKDKYGEAVDEVYLLECLKVTLPRRIVSKDGLPDCGVPAEEILSYLFGYTHN